MAIVGSRGGKAIGGRHGGGLQREERMASRSVELLFWLGTIADTPRGRLLLTAAPLPGRESKRRIATKEEASQAQFFLESHVAHASSSERQALFELYCELTGNRFHGIDNKPALSAW